MIQTKKIGKLTEIYATQGYLHRKDTQNYDAIKRRILLPAESPQDYEEVMELPKYTREEYETTVNQLIRQRYSDSEEYAIQRKAMNLLLNPQAIDEEDTGIPAAVAEFQAYNAYAEQCKTQAIQQLNNRPTQQYEPYNTHN